VTNMKSNVKIIKRLKISEVIVKPENIRELAEKVYKEYNQYLETNKHISVEFILNDPDGTQYESENTEIFSNGGILDTSRQFLKYGKLYVTGKFPLKMWDSLSVIARSAATKQSKERLGQISSIFRRLPRLPLADSQ